MILLNGVYINTFQDRISFKDLLLDPRMLSANGRQVLQNQFGALSFTSSRFSADNIRHYLISNPG